MSGLRRISIVLAISATHLVCGFALFAASYGASMDRMDSGLPPSFAESLVSLASGVLWFPASALAGIAGGGWFSGLWGWPLLVANSLLWGTVMTYATLLLSRGTQPTYVQKSLGHASVQLTLDRYSHWMPSMGRNTAEGIVKALGR
jgi:hypothetical protein